MADFKYKAKNKKGEIKEGEFSIQEKKQVYDDLRKNDFILISLEKIKKENEKSFVKERLAGHLERITLEDKMIFTHHLSVMIGAGLSLPKALDILKNQARTDKFRNIIGSISDDIKKGETLAGSFSKFPKIFGSLYSNMIKAGEESGNIQYILNLLSKYLEKENSLKSRLKGALIYPILIFAVMAGIGAVMMIFVIPKLAVIFTEMGAKLPIATSILIFFSLWVKNNFIALLADLAILILAIKIACSFSFSKRFFHYAQLKLPFFGKLYKKINSARFARITSSLLSAGVSVSDSLKITSGTLPNIYYKESLLEAAKEVQAGKTLQESLEKFEFLYPLLVTQMIEIGEETGGSGDILSKLADFYEEDIDNATKNISSIIEPVLMIVIGIAVGFFAVSMLMPMYSILGSV